MPLLQELEEERNKLREQLAELSQRIESLDHDNVSSLAAKWGHMIMFLLNVVKTVWDNDHPTVASESFFSFQAFGDEDPRDGE